MADIVTRRSMHNILTVPPEITERIAQVAEGDDLLNLRLVCKEVDARTLRTYGQTHFAYRRLLLHSGERLGVLLEIAQSDRLAGFVKVISLLVDGIGTPQSEMLEMIGWNWQADAHDIYDDELTLLKKGENPRDAMEYDENDHGIETVFRLHILTKVFSALRQRNVRPSIDVLDLTFLKSMISVREDRDVLPDYRPPHWRRKARELRLTPDIIRLELRPIFDSLALSGISIETLGIASFIWGLRLYEMSLHEDTFNAMKSVVTNLRSLVLWVDLDGHDNDKSTSLLAETLTRAPHLQTLELRALIPPHAPHIGDLFLRHTFSELKFLMLMNWSMTCKDLCQFLRLQPALEALRLDICDLSLDERHVGLEPSSDGEICADLQERGAAQQITLYRCRVGGRVVEWDDEGINDDGESGVEDDESDGTGDGDMGAEFDEYEDDVE